MKTSLKYILYINVSFFLLPFLVHLLDEQDPFLGSVVHFIQLYQQLIWMISGVIGGTSGLLLFVLLSKQRRALAVIEKANEQDRFWDETSICHHCRYVFYTLYDSLLNEEHPKIQSMVTGEFYNRFSEMKANAGITAHDIVNPVDITETYIIRAADTVIDDNDAVSVCLAGYFLRPAEGTSTEAATFAVDKQAFRVLCRFRRYGNDWKLEELDDSFNFWELLLVRKSEFQQ